MLTSDLHNDPIHLFLEGSVIYKDRTQNSDGFNLKNLVSINKSLFWFRFSFYWYVTVNPVAENL